MFIHLFLYIDDIVFSCGCKDEIWATKGLLDKAKGNVLGMEIVRDQSGNTLRVSHSRFYNEKLVQTLLEGHSKLSLEGSLSGDCDVEKNGKWSCIYAVGSQEYQMVCTRLDIASADVGMLDKFDRGLQINVQVFVDFDYTMGRSITVMGRSITRYELMIQGCAGSREAMMLHMMALSLTEAGYMTLTEAAKEAIWLKGLAIESGFELKIVAGITIGDLSKAIPGPRFQHKLNLLSIGSISTWEDLTTCFLAQFFLPGRTAKLQNDILMLQQHQAGGKLHDKNAEESWALLEDLILYDNESWNELKDFAKPVMAICLPQDVPSTSDRRLIELKNQVQRFMEAYLAPKSSIQVNKLILHGQETSNKPPMLGRINQTLVGYELKPSQVHKMAHSLLTPPVMKQSLRGVVSEKFDNTPAYDTTRNSMACANAVSIDILEKEAPRRKGIVRNLVFSEVTIIIDLTSLCNS
ncbi:hypothetical protein Tco_0867212 [Tanacetum coccineum]